MSKKTSVYFGPPLMDLIGHLTDEDSVSGRINRCAQRYQAILNHHGIDLDKEETTILGNCLHVSNGKGLALPLRHRPKGAASKEKIMTTVTIYTETHRDACLYGLEENESEVYDENIELYFDYLKSEAEDAGIEIEFENNGNGRSYYTESEEGQQFMEDLVADFWNWYN